MAMEYYSFERVLKELLIEEDELKRLVSEGEIRAFRDEDKMKFKRSDIDGIRKGRMTEPTIILPSGADGSSSESGDVVLVEEDTSETLLDIDDISGGSSSTSVPTVDFGSSSDDSASETLTEELVFDEQPGFSGGDSAAAATMTEELESQDTFIDEGDTGMTTEPLELLESSDEVPSVQRRQAAPASRGASGAPAPRSVPGRMPMAAPKRSHPILTALLVCTAACVLYSGVLVYSLIEGNDNEYTGGVTDTVVSMFSVVPDFAAGNPAAPQPAEVNKHIQVRRDARRAQKTR
jgi:hypothetical protein